ncbi:DUF3413 domain-containing protein [Escherichia coli]
MRFLSVILATAGMTLLLIDSEVFTRFHLHLNPIVWQLVINPDENEMARDWQLMFISVPVILLLELVFATWSWQKLRSLTSSALRAPAGRILIYRLYRLACGVYLGRCQLLSPYHHAAR